MEIHRQNPVNARCGEHVGDQATTEEMREASFLSERAYAKCAG